MDIKRIKHLAGIEEAYELNPDISEYKKLAEKYAHLAFDAATEIAIEFVKKAREQGLKPTATDVSSPFGIPDESDVLSRLAELLQDYGFQQHR